MSATNEDRFRIRIERTFGLVANAMYRAVSGGERYRYKGVPENHDLAYRTFEIIATVNVWDRQEDAGRRLVLVKFDDEKQVNVFHYATLQELFNCRLIEPATDA